MLYLPYMQYRYDAAPNSFAAVAAAMHAKSFIFKSEYNISKQ